jgi:protein SCO1
MSVWPPPCAAPSMAEVAEIAGAPPAESGARHCPERISPSGLFVGAAARLLRRRLSALAPPLALLALAVAATPRAGAAAAPRPPDRGAAVDSAAAEDAAVAAAAAWTERVRAAPQPPALPPETGPASPARKYFTDVELVDQDGRPQRLYSDLLQGKTVVIDAFFTSCSGACPVLGEKLAALQQWLGDRLGKEVYLLSFTVDPQHDTPARLKQYATRLGARPGWFFLTGKKENVDWALYKLGHYVEKKEDHSNLLVIGNEPTGLWKKVFGLARSEELIRSLDAVLHDRG